MIIKKAIAQHELQSICQQLWSENITTFSKIQHTILSILKAVKFALWITVYTTILRLQNVFDNLITVYEDRKCSKDIRQFMLKQENLCKWEKIIKKKYLKKSKVEHKIKFRSKYTQTQMRAYTYIHENIYVKTLPRKQSRILRKVTALLRLW